MLSIIIPTFNRLQMLQELLKSIECQTYKDIEVIIIADSCSDGTNEFLEQYQFPNNWRYFVNETSLNAGGSRKRGFLESKGELVTFIDDDDYLMDANFYIDAIKLFAKYPQLSIVAANSINKYEDTGAFEKITINKFGYVNNIEYLAGFQYKWYKPCPSFAIFRRSSLIDADIVHMNMVNDCPLYLRALLVGDIYIMKEPMGVYRIHSKNISKSISADFIIENLKEKEYIYQRLKYYNLSFNLSRWWYRMMRLTFDYFVCSNPSNLEQMKVMKWCRQHCYNSIYSLVYFYFYDYIPYLSILHDRIKRILFRNN